MKGLLDIYNSIVEFFELKEIFSKKAKCPNCGYVFKKRKTIYFNLEECQKRFFLFNNKKQDRLKRKFEKNPRYCVVCKNKLNLRPGIIGNFCPECRFISK